MSEDYNATHARRFEVSLEWIAPYAEKAISILELGGTTRFTEMVQKRWPGRIIPHYGGDLRNGFDIRHPVDLILAQEIIEHLHDRECKEMSTQWMASGVKKLFLSCAMALKNGGHLFLTSPNPCSITAIHHALNLLAPMVYQPHVREYPVFQLDDMARSVGFKIVRRETLDVWRNAITDAQHNRIARFIKDAQYPQELRGEDTFMLLGKP